MHLLTISQKFIKWKKYIYTKVLYLKLIPLAVYNKRLPGTILGWGLARASESQYVYCQSSLLYYVTYLTPPISLCTLLTPKTKQEIISHTSTHPGRPVHKMKGYR